VKLIVKLIVHFIIQTHVNSKPKLIPKFTSVLILKFRAHKKKQIPNIINTFKNAYQITSTKLANNKH
jgi:hypothetical protein